ncbi:hypothetical protein GCM10010389_20530 [Streptomyces echinoruber]|uniref:Uncharacterized protein n=1 Tax=Streptomyces echinoruber TaxID=68898 RepID=A0A918V9W1_9ACTN|nr:hypothetical protein GCM10010389_20530 [Streptomyces echinoruber]
MVRAGQARETGVGRREVAAEQYVVDPGAEERCGAGGAGRGTGGAREQGGVAQADGEDAAEGGVVLGGVEVVGRDGGCGVVRGGEGAQPVRLTAPQADLARQRGHRVGKVQPCTARPCTSAAAPGMPLVPGSVYVPRRGNRLRITDPWEPPAATVRRWGWAVPHACRSDVRQACAPAPVPPLAGSGARRGRRRAHGDRRWFYGDRGGEGRARAGRGGAVFPLSWASGWFRRVGLSRAPGWFRRVGLSRAPGWFRPGRGTVAGPGPGRRRAATRWRGGGAGGGRARR